MWHMLEEELQHRGEPNALFWQMDIGPPIDAWFAERSPGFSEKVDILPRLAVLEAKMKGLGRK
jgi:hypothetical protein